MQIWLLWHDMDMDLLSQSIETSVSDLSASLQIISSAISRYSKYWEEGGSAISSRYSITSLDKHLDSRLTDLLPEAIRLN